MLPPRLLHGATFLTYAVAAVLYLANLVKERKPVARAARWTLGGAALLHFSQLLADWALAGQVPFTDIHGALTSLALLLVVGYLLVGLRAEMPAAGAFITPGVLALLVISEFKAPGSTLPAQAGVIRPIHIAMAMVGTAAFFIAFVVAVMYLVLERALKEKKFGAVYHRFPSLDVLDSVNYRAIVVGFPLLTLGIVTGALFARKIDASVSLNASHLQYGLAVLAWLFFAVVLNARITAGWRGRRTALLTIGGFASALGVLAVYLVR